MYFEFIYSHVIVRYLYNRSPSPCVFRVHENVRAFSVFYRARTSQQGGGDAVKWNILVFSVVFAVRTCSIAPHLPAPFWCGGDAVKWNILVFSVVFAVRTCSIDPHLPAPFWCGRVFGQCEERGDHLSRRFLSETG